MLRPRDFVGNEYFVTVATDCGEIRRCVVGFDQDDALGQMLDYCKSEGLQALNTSIL